MKNSNAISAESDSFWSSWTKKDIYLVLKIGFRVSNTLHKLELKTIVLNVFHLISFTSR